MKLLLRCDHPLQAAHFANVLRAAGIRCEVRNTTLSGAMGDIPWLECAPQVWIDDALQADRALALLREVQAAAHGPHWHCNACGEELEPQFGQCWRCGTARAV